MSYQSNYGSKTDDEFIARMRDAGYEDWEIQEEIAERDSVIASNREYTNSLREEGAAAQKASEQLANESKINPTRSVDSLSL